MNAEGFDVDALLKMAHSPVRNYVLPGLTSSLIGAPSTAGTVRLFECEREHQESITPHSHRFDFQCWVLRGVVRNRVWRKAYSRANADLYRCTTLRYRGSMGDYERVAHEDGLWQAYESVYAKGQCYAMTHDEIHSIFFSRGAIVLFFEGEVRTSMSVALEPLVDGEIVPTLEVKPWMFKREAASPESR